MSGTEVQCSDRPLIDAETKRRLWKKGVISKENKGSKTENVEMQSHVASEVEETNDEDYHRRLERLREQLGEIREDLVNMRRQDQTIVRQLLNNYATFLQLLADSQRRSLTITRLSQSFVIGSPATVTDFRLETVKSYQSQHGDLNIRDISRRLNPPIRRRRESEPPFFLGHRNSFSFEKAFQEGVFSDDEDSSIDPLSASSFT